MGFTFLLDDLLGFFIVYWFKGSLRENQEPSCELVSSYNAPWGGAVSWETLLGCLRPSQVCLHLHVL